VKSYFFQKVLYSNYSEAPLLPSSFFFRLTRIDKASLFFICFILFSFILNYDHLSLPLDVDQHYHIAVARKITECGTIPEWDDWEYAPAGRPHLYPPALHLAIALIAQTPENILWAFTILQVFVYPLALLLIWWAVRWGIGGKMAFISVLVFSIDMISFFSLLAVLPGIIITSLIPVIAMLFLGRYHKTTIALLVFSLYTHTGMGLLLLAGLFLYSLLNRDYLRFFGIIYLWFPGNAQMETSLCSYYEMYPNGIYSDAHFLRGQILAANFSHMGNFCGILFFAFF